MPVKKEVWIQPVLGVLYLSIFCEDWSRFANRLLVLHGSSQEKLKRGGGFEICIFVLLTHSLDHIKENLL